MTAWWNELELAKQIFYTIAVPATVILIIQTIMSLVGLTDLDSDMDGLEGGHDGFDGLNGTGFDSGDGADVYEINLHSEGATDEFAGDFRFFTIRGIIAFFTIFGWTGAALTGQVPFIITLLVALLAGSFAMVMIGYLFYAMIRLQSSGNIEYTNCIGKTGEVYLTIPPFQQGKGKVMITIQERLIEVNAITKLTEPIKTGESVNVVGILSDHTLIVERN